MIFKAIAAALALLPMLTGGTCSERDAHERSQISAELPGALQRHLPDLRLLDSKPSAPVKLGNVMTHAAERVTHAARPHTPEPRTLMLLGLGLLLFGLRRHFRPAPAARRDRAASNDRGQDRIG
jgi:hypothetical protein